MATPRTAALPVRAAADGLARLRDLDAHPVPTYVAEAADGRRLIVERLPLDARPGLPRLASALARLHHPNLAHFRKVELIAGDCELASDYVDGESLAELLRLEAQQADGESSGSSLPLEVKLRVVIDALSGLSALHLHRDEAATPLGLWHGFVAPSNLLVGADGATRLVHLLLPLRARLPESELAYAAPERAKGDGTPRSDIFSVGVLLERIVGTVQGAELGWAAPLKDVAKRATSPESTARFTTAAEMATELRKIIKARLASPIIVAAAIDELAGDRIEARKQRLVDLRQKAQPTSATVVAKPVAAKAPLVPSPPARPAQVAKPQPPAPTTPAARAPAGEPPAKPTALPGSAFQDEAPTVQRKPPPELLAPGPPPKPAAAAPLQPAPARAQALAPAPALPPPPPLARAPVPNRPPAPALAPAPAPALAPAPAPVPAPALAPSPPIEPPKPEVSHAAVELDVLSTVRTPDSIPVEVAADADGPRATYPLRRTPRKAVVAAVLAGALLVLLVAAANGLRRRDASTADSRAAVTATEPVLPSVAAQPTATASPTETASAVAVPPSAEENPAAQTTAESPAASPPPSAPPPGETTPPRAAGPAIAAPLPRAPHPDPSRAPPPPAATYDPLGI